MSRRVNEYHLSPSRSPQQARPLKRFRVDQRQLSQIAEQHFMSDTIVSPLSSEVNSPISPPSIPIPPLHGDASCRPCSLDSAAHHNSIQPSVTNTTPGADNFGEQAGGGIAGIAMGVASANARESGLEAMRRIQNPDYNRSGVELHHYKDSLTSSYGRSLMAEGGSQSSIMPLGAAAAPVAFRSRSRNPLNPYSDGPYDHRHSRHLDFEFDPNNIEDDGDDGLEYPSHRSASNRTSMLSLGQYSNADRAAGAASSASAPASASPSAGSTSHLRGDQASPQYVPVSNGAPDGGTAYPGHTMADLGWAAEKKEWLQKEQRQNKKSMWIIIAIITLLLISALVGGIAAGILSHQDHAPPDSNSAANDQAQNGDLTKNSAEIRALMNNRNLHKVFPGIDYTPINTQYPDCLTNPPSQNNVTRDLAVLSQLTNVIRLYGTDCNQTEMLLHSISALEMDDTMKIWLGVWQGTNKTTNARQLAQMYSILDTYDASHFKGIIVGNEILFRKDMTATELGSLITEVRTNLTAKGIDLKLATSDLGDAWADAGTLVTDVDYIMSNVHPFFAGVQADVAAAWAVEFWGKYDKPLAAAAANAPKNIISETGWPSAGGMDCGAADTCTNGSVAGIDEMNTFMGTFVCQALANGTEFFWFEAFDEPWKILDNKPGKSWEDKWGLMDVDRNLKSGIIIPDCDGKTVDSLEGRGIGNL